jgi:site-specific DNA-cytosine methylase
MNRGGQGLEGEKSKLFHTFIDVLKRTKPRFFILENTFSMTNENRDVITAELGVEPVMIDSSWFGAQRRKRWFWANFPLPTTHLTPSRARLVDILDPIIEAPLTHSPLAMAWLKKPFRGSDRLHHFGQVSDRLYARTVMATFAKGVPNNVLTDMRYTPPIVRPFTVAEVGRLQGLPDWCSGISRTGALKCLGNAVNGDVAVFLFQMLMTHILIV